MPIPFSSRQLLALPLMAPLFGCASKPPERPIVLRPPHAAKVTASRPPVRPRQEARTGAAPANATQANAAADEPAPAPALAPTPADQNRLSSDKKEALFRDF